MTFKICKQCKENKSIKEYYKSYGSVYASLCKPCHNKKRTINYQKQEKIYKKTGFEKLDEETKKRILEDIKNKLKYKAIASKNNVSYGSLLKWKKHF